LGNLEPKAKNIQLKNKRPPLRSALFWNIFAIGLMPGNHTLLKEIALLFKLKDNVFFHTTFSYRIADDSWHWEMTNDENGKKDSLPKEIKSKKKKQITVFGFAPVSCPGQPHLYSHS